MSDYLTDEEQLEKLKNWWQANGMALVGIVVVAVVGVVGWSWFSERQAAEVAGSSDLYVAFLEAEDTERESIEAAIAAEYPDSTYHVLVLLRRSQALMAEEDAEAALAPLTAALDAAADTKLADLIRLRLARVQQQLDRSNEALATLGAVRSLGLRSQVQELKGDIHMVRGQRREAHEAYSAALADAGEGTQRPLLEMKVADTADTNDT